ncbi:MAG TPA: hypothetical protein VHE55_12585 [Fimbriimonadaceae bacterium]|nr:hypothetical protein [Fimbriimonadaceae bacterium]
MGLAIVPIVLAAFSPFPAQQSNQRISILGLASLVVHVPGPHFDERLASQLPEPTTGISAGTLTIWQEDKVFHSVSFVFRPNTPQPKPAPASIYSWPDFYAGVASTTVRCSADKSVLVAGRAGLRHTETCESAGFRQVGVRFSVPSGTGLLEVECSILSGSGQYLDVGQVKADADAIVSSWKWTSASP